jgi:hypothetical protein
MVNMNFNLYWGLLLRGLMINVYYPECEALNPEENSDLW